MKEGNLFMYMSDKQHTKRVFEDSVDIGVADTTLLHELWHKIGKFLNTSMSLVLF